MQVPYKVLAQYPKVLNKNIMQIYRLINSNGEHISLFTSKRIDANVNVDIRNAVIQANGNTYLYNKLLEELKIYPVYWVEDVIMNEFILFSEIT